MERFVVDASIAVAWLHKPQSTPVSAAALQAVEEGALLFAPALWPIEVANALLVLERRGRISATERTKALEQIREFPVTLDLEAFRAFREFTKLACDHQLSVYDASYLELAVRTTLPLACKDGPLREAAKRVGVRLRD